jgi:hypothetical protein
MTLRNLFGVTNLPNRLANTVTPAHHHRHHHAHLHLFDLRLIICTTFISDIYLHCHTLYYLPAHISCSLAVRLRGAGKQQTYAKPLLLACIDLLSMPQSRPGALIIRYGCRDAYRTRQFLAAIEAAFHSPGLPRFTS